MYFFNDIIKIVDFYFDNILLVKKAKKNIFVSDIPYKTFFGSKLLPIRLDEIDRLLEFMMELLGY